MPNTVKFEVSADVAAAVNAVLKVVNATDKVAEGFTKSAQSSDRASRKMQADARATVAKIQATTGSSSLTGQGWNVDIARSATARAIRSSRMLTRSRGDDLKMIGEISKRQRELRETKEAAGEQLVKDFERNWRLQQPVIAHQKRVWSRDWSSGVRRYNFDDPEDRAAARSERARELRSERFQTRSRSQSLNLISQSSANQRDLRELRERNQAEAARVKGFTDDIDFNNFSTKMQKHHAARDKLKSQAMWAGGIAVSAGMYAANQTMQSFDESRDRSVNFANDFRKVATLGDNIDDITGKRSQVLAFSAAWGVASEKITAAMYSIESAASNLSKGEQADILTGSMQFNRLQGADPELSGKAILKYKEIWGTGVNEAKNRLFRTADLGDLDIDKAATFGPDLWAKAQASGFGKTDTDAMSVIATQKLGRTEKTFTGLGDVLQKLPKVGAAIGINLNRDRSFLDQLAPLMSTQQGRDRLGAENAFGTDVGVVQALFGSRRELDTTAQQLDASANGDPVAEKLNKLLSDTTMHFAEMSGVLEQLNKNQVLTQGFAEKWGKMSENLDAGELGARQNLGPMFSWLAKPAAWSEQLLSAPGINALPGADFYKNAIGGNFKQAFMEPFADPGQSLSSQGKRIAATQADAAGRAGIFGSTGSPDVSSNAMYMTALDMAKADGKITPDEQAGLDGLIAALKNAAAAAEGMKKPRAPRDTNAHN